MVILQGSKGQKMVKFGYFATFWQLAQNWSDNFSLFCAYSFLGMILINYQEMGLIELFKRFQGQTGQVWSIFAIINYIIR